MNDIVGLKTGTYQNFEWLFVHVTNNGTSQANVPGAIVSLLDPNDNSIVYTGVTNASGWAKISVLQAETNASSSVNRTYYVVQAQSGGLLSNEAYLTTNNTSYLTLLLNPASRGNQNLNYFTYVLRSDIGVPEATMGIYTNAYPLNFVNNASFSELDFNTVGGTGTNYTFVVAYPANFTTAPLTVSVDQVPLKSVTITSNKTYYFATFSVPSGYHSVALAYVSPNSNYANVVNPILNPGLSVILAVILLLVVGCIFIFYYVRRQNILAKANG